MHFEILHTLRGTEQNVVLDARVGDPLYKGATINWKGYSKADWIWFWEQFDAALTHWPDAKGREHRLQATLDPTTKAETYTLDLRKAGGAWAPCPAWDSLDDEAREAISARLDAILESVHALLLIF